MPDNSLGEISKEAVVQDHDPTFSIEEYTDQFNAFFGFREMPFNNTPNPNLFYMSENHREALTSMLFGVKQRRGFIVVTGEIGAGKTTLCRRFLGNLSSEIKTAVILNPNLSGTHLLASIVQDFDIPCRGKSKKDYFDALNHFLLEGLEQGQNAVLIIDEAQRLSAKVLEEVRLLSNLETSKQKLLQIVLMGQPELKDILLRPDLTQLRQRVGVLYHLKGLSLSGTRSYIEHRLECVREGVHPVVFDNFVIGKIHLATRGIPRLINALSDRILMSAYAQHTRLITWEVSQAAFEEMDLVCS